jgi:hypothetical protein
VRVGPIVCGQLLALRSTIAGCSGPIAGPSQAALVVVHPWALAGQLESNLDHRAAAVGSLVEGILALEADSPGFAQGSLDPEAGIAVAVEDSHQAVDLDRRMNRKLRAHQAHHETNLGMGLCALKPRQ